MHYSSFNTMFALYYHMMSVHRAEEVAASVLARHQEYHFNSPVFADRALPEPVGSMAKGSWAACCQSGLPKSPYSKGTFKSPLPGMRSRSGPGPIFHIGLVNSGL